MADSSKDEQEHPAPVVVAGGGGGGGDGGVAALIGQFAGTTIHTPAQLYLKTHGCQGGLLNEEDVVLVNKYLRIITPTLPGHLNWSPGQRVSPPAIGVAEKKSNDGGGGGGGAAIGTRVFARGWEHIFDEKIKDVMRMAAQGNGMSTMMEGGEMVHWHPGDLWTYGEEGDKARGAFDQMLQDSIPMEKGTPFSTTFQLEGGPKKMITYNWLFSPESSSVHEVATVPLVVLSDGARAEISKSFAVGASHQDEEAAAAASGADILSKLTPEQRRALGQEKNDRDDDLEMEEAGALYDGRDTQQWAHNLLKGDLVKIAKMMKKKSGLGTPLRLNMIVYSCRRTQEQRAAAAAAAASTAGSSAGGGGGQQWRWRRRRRGSGGSKTRRKRTNKKRKIRRRNNRKTRRHRKRKTRRRARRKRRKRRK